MKDKAGFMLDLRKEFTVGDHGLLYSLKFDANMCNIILSRIESIFSLCTVKEDWRFYGIPFLGNLDLMHCKLMLH